MTPKFDNTVNENMKGLGLAALMALQQGDAGAVDVNKTTKTYDTNKPDAVLAQNQLISQFREYLKAQENDALAGWNSKTKRWMPHKSVEGGTRTLAYGHKFPSAAAQKQWYKDNPTGITNDEAEQLLTNDINEHIVRAKGVVDSKHGKGTWDKLPFESQLMLTDYEFNVGLTKFPTFTKAVISNDWDTAKKEYKRYTGKKELTRRNNAFFNLFLKNKPATKIEYRNP